MIRTALLFICVFCFCLSADVYAQVKTENPAIQKANLIFPLQHEHTHGSSIVELSNGDLLAAWFQGSGERKADDVRVMGARLKKGAKAWSPPFVMADTYEHPDCNPVLFLNRQGTLFLVWIAVLANRWENSILVLKTSDDYLASREPKWTRQDNIFLKPGEEFENEVRKKFKELTPNTAGWTPYAPRYDDMIMNASKDVSKRSIGWMTRIHPLVLDNGRILLPLYSDGFNFSLIAISDNHGATWKPSLPMVGRGNVQPSLIRKKNGNIMAFMRDNGDAPARVQTSISTDEGMSWSAAGKTDIPNTASVQVVPLKNGDWALIGNMIDDGRYELSLWISDDEGATWKRRMFLEKTEKGEGSFSYPAMIEGQDGLLHITYSYAEKDRKAAIKYLVVNPAMVP